MIVDEDIEDFLEHHGVRGMRWGQRKANRALNQASRKKDKVARDKAIDRARSRTQGTTRLKLTDKGSKSHTDYKKARAVYKEQKSIVGSREARKVLNKAKEKRINEIQTSQMAKSGKETTVAVLAAAGYIALRVLASKH